MLRQIPKFDNKNNIFLSSWNPNVVAIVDNINRFKKNNHAVLLPILLIIHHNRHNLKHSEVMVFIFVIGTKAKQKDILNSQMMIAIGMTESGVFMALEYTLETYYRFL